MRIPSIRQFTVRALIWWKARLENRPIDSCCFTPLTCNISLLAIDRFAWYCFTSEVSRDYLLLLLFAWNFLVEKIKNLLFSVYSSLGACMRMWVPVDGSAARLLIMTKKKPTPAAPHEVQARISTWNGPREWIALALSYHFLALMFLWLLVFQIEITTAHRG